MHRSCGWDSNPDGRMVGADESTELWPHPISFRVFERTKLISQK